MSSYNPPNYSFNNIIYNSSFFSSGTNMTNYLLRVGTAISTAVSTTFYGSVTTNGITDNVGITTVTPILTDNSTRVSTTAFVKGLNYTTLSNALAAIQANINIFTAQQTFSINPIFNTHSILDTYLSSN